MRPQFAEIQFSTFPQQTVQLVENQARGAVEALTVGSPSVSHPRPPSFSPGFTAFLWGLGLGVLIWLGLLAVGVTGATSFIVGAVSGAAIFVFVRVNGARGRRRESG